MKKHQKHSNLTKRNNGNYAPNEIAVLGSKCLNISKIVQKVAKKLQKKYHLAYFDASHNFEKDLPFIDNYTFNKNGFSEEILAKKYNPYQLKITFNHYDLVFINGNHYKATKQILILDNEKKSSVLKRLSQLDNVQFIIKLDEKTPFFDFLIEAYPEIKNLNSYHIDQVDKIANHIENIVKEEISRVNGLVLIGGKSTRMGTDKSILNYHGKPQREFLFDLLSDSLNTENVFYSVREPNQINSSQIIADKFLNLGPFGGICSAFQYNPNVAWLVVATDLPNFNKETLSLLLKHRNPSKIATTFKGKNKQFPEPLITIWEPKAYSILLQFLAQGYSCPRKVLINNNVEIVEIDDEIIQNINTKEEFDSFKI
jgi:molybdopterin-guanine dinucleotide biosynthesis protein A